MIGSCKKGKKMIKKWLFCGSIAFLSLFLNDINAYVYQISVMKKVIDPQLSQEQLVIGIGDYHDKDHPANADQRAYLEALLKKCRAIKSKLIVEDLSSVNSDGRGMCCNLFINAQGGLLGKLADKARAECIDVDNVEYRFCRVVGIGPLINSYQNNQQKNNSSATIIPVQEVCKEFLQELDKVQHYNDGVVANRFYKKIIGDVSKSFNHLKIDKVKDQAVAHYCAQEYKNNYIKSLEKLCIFDSPIIDAKIIHSIVSSPEKSIIIVAAGGSHLEKINTQLELLGYCKVIIPAVTNHMHQMVENLLNSGKKEKSRVYRPPAINIQVIDQFVP